MFAGGCTPHNRGRPVFGAAPSGHNPPTRTIHMNRLQSELARLYLPRPSDHVDVDVPSTNLIDAKGRVRAMVIELARPADWDTLSRVWHGVQVELELPAPAIAVSGTDGLQLWFSLAEPIAVAQAHAFLAGLQQRFLADIKPVRVRLMPAADASASRQDLHAALVPAQQTDGSGNWSAFLAPDLVPVFAESPWLDIPPNEEGQATLLRSIAVMALPAFDGVFAMLGRTTQPETTPVAAAAPGADEYSVAHHKPQPVFARSEDPKQFLLQVMNDDAVALVLRIKAAKALLQHSGNHSLPQGD
jgi:hypothetical protein